MHSSLAPPLKNLLRGPCTTETWINSGRCQGWVHGYTCYCCVLSSSNINVTPFLIECTPNMTFHPRIKSTYSLWEILWLLVTLHSRNLLRNGCPHVIQERPLMSEFLNIKPVGGIYQSRVPPSPITSKM